MRRLGFTLVALWLWWMPAPSGFAPWAHQQSGTAVNGNDSTFTFGAAPAADHKVIIGSCGTTEAQTISITGWDPGITTTIGPIDSAGDNLRCYVFCAAGDGADTAFVATTSGTMSARTMAAAFSGGSCTQDGSTQSNDVSGAGGTPDEYLLSTDVTVTQTDSLLVGLMTVSTGGASYTMGTNFTEIGQISGAAFQFRILTASGAFDTPFQTAAAESGLLLGAAFQSDGVAAAKCHRGLLKVGC